MKASTLLIPLLCLILVAAAADAQQIIQVTKTTTKNQQGPHISPDGSMLIWGEQDTGNTYDHFVFAADTKTLVPNQITFTPHQSSSSPNQWQISGDGKTVVFVNNYDLWKVPSSGGTPTQLTNFGGPPGIVNYAYPISLSHDGSKACFTYFYYTSSPTTIRTYDLYVLDTNTKKITNVTQAAPNSNDLVTAWISGDGKTVTFTQKRSGTYPEVWLAASDGTNIRQLTTMAVARTYYPQIDANSKICAFASWPSSNYDVYTILTDGSFLTTISAPNNTDSDYAPQVSADGERVIWKSGVSSSTGDLFMNFPEGGNLRQLTQFGNIPPLYGNVGAALNGDGTMAVFNSKFDYNGGNPDGNLEIYLWKDALTRTGVAQPGNTIDFNIEAPVHAGEVYQMACSAFRSPGIPLPGAGVVPLTPDALFFFSISAPAVFQNFAGVLDASGKATGKVAIPNIAGLSGFAFQTSFITVGTNNVITIYNPVKVTIQ